MKLLIGFILLALVVCSYIIIEEQKERNLESVFVTRVLDGDTFETSQGNKVRLIGINTPEVNQFYYKEARLKLNSLVFNKTVILKSEKKDRDAYHRLLRDVYLEDGTFVNELLVREGYAVALDVRPNDKYSSLIIKAENYAKFNKWGIWNIS